MNEGTHGKVLGKLDRYVHVRIIIISPRLPSNQPHLDIAQGLGSCPMGGRSLFPAGWVSVVQRKTDGMEVSRHCWSSPSHTENGPSLKLQNELSTLVPPLGAVFLEQWSGGQQDWKGQVK